jgi:hypothetical protein
MGKIQVFGILTPKFYAFGNKNSSNNEDALIYF